MSWARFDDRAAWHRKTIRAGNEAFGAWARMVIQSCAQGTDGYVTRDEAVAICGREEIIKKLIEVELLDDDPSKRQASQNFCFKIHDFLDWNESAKSISERRDKLRESRSKAGKVGGAKSAKNRVKSIDPSKRQANVKQVACVLLKQNEALSSPDPEERNLTPLTSFVAPSLDSEKPIADQTSVSKKNDGLKSKVRKPSIKKASIALPQDFVLTDELREYALNQGVLSPEDTFECFRLHYLAKGTHHANWCAALQLWFRNHKKFEREPLFRTNTQRPGRAKQEPPPGGSLRKSAGEFRLDDENDSEPAKDASNGQR